MPATARWKWSKHDAVKALLILSRLSVYCISCISYLLHRPVALGHSQIGNGRDAVAVILRWRFAATHVARGFLHQEALHISSARWLQAVVPAHPFFCAHAVPRDLPAPSSVVAAALYSPSLLRSLLQLPAPCELACALRGACEEGAMVYRGQFAFASTPRAAQNAHSMCKSCADLACVPARSHSCSSLKLASFPWPP